MLFIALYNSSTAYKALIVFRYGTEVNNFISYEDGKYTCITRVLIILPVSRDLDQPYMHKPRKKDEVYIFIGLKSYVQIIHFQLLTGT